MTQRYLRCLLGPLNGQHRWIDSRQNYYEAVVFPEMELSTLGSMMKVPLESVFRKEIYVVKSIRWNEENIPVLVPDRYSEKEITEMLAETLFR